ncbi:MAG: fasciclin domain-containing protein, partial [Bacteroidales bacterium]|nr:fasciclin domain-containing protein [Bacteroidales bacterium]
MKKLNLILLSLTLIGAFVFTSCEKDPKEEPKTIVDVAVDNGFNVLAAAIVEAGLVDDLEGTGPFTVFAPTDAAFGALGITAANVGQVDGLVSILKYHVIAGKIMSSSLTSGTVTMLSGAEAEIDATNLKINDSKIIAPFDLEGSNGVVHSIDAVLLPPQNLVQTAIDAGYNVLAAGLVAAGLDDDLQGAGPFTVFAPTDAVFNAAGVTAANIADVPGLAEILLYHVVAGEIMSGDLTTGDVATLNSQTIAIDASALTVNDASIISPFDVKATNGVIHTIDEILIPEFDLVTSALFYGYNSLAAAVVEAGLVSALQGTGPFTVFAPTDAAFDALYTDLGVGGPADVDDDLLEAVLLYHVLSGEVRSGDLVSGDVETLSGKYAYIDATALTIDDANIIAPYDFDATNGVIHTIDAVILPAKNIVETAVATADLSILVDVLTLYPDLVTTLSDETGAFTVFAPTNAAFAALLTAIGQTSATDIPEDVLKSVLQYHVIAANEIYSTNLADGATVTTVNGEDIIVTEVGGSFFISGVGINTADVMTSNGVVHIMDGVLVPPSVLQFVNTIVEPAYFNKNFTTLIAAVKAASPSILETLLGEGPSSAGMTLFAPTNDAFAAAGITELPDQATLDAVLTYHLIDGVVLSTDLPATTVAAPAVVNAVGGILYLSNKGEGVFLNGNTQVIVTDIDPSEGAGTANGVVHVINRTLVPPADDIVTIAIDLGFSKLADALTEAGLVST